MTGVQTCALPIYLCRRADDSVLGGRIVEVEAYIHEEDRACHARHGPTPRARIMFGPPGRAYVYLVYGMHDCLNVVCEPDGVPAAVLVRAVEPEPGLQGRTDGPGKLCRALRITRAHNGLDLCRARLWIEEGEPARRVAATERIGVERSKSVV